MRHFLRAPTLVFGLLAALALGACSGGGARKPLVCPSVIVLADAATATVPLAGSEAAKARIANTSVTCERSDEGLVAAVTIVFKAKRLKTGAPADLTMPFFVTATEADKRVLSKAVLPVTFAWEPDAVEAQVSIDVNDIAVPIAEGKKSWEYEIVIGYQLSAAQLEYNRSQQAP
ncbi:MAG: hypothetical protein GC199_06195 [Alphaproteobacteria bacterium]|nr:hypothetical protein [Alphaproteobacteria bacterium]